MTTDQQSNPSTNVFSAGDVTAIAAIEEILQDRERAAIKERTVIEGLNTALARIGYKIVPLRMSKSEASSIESPKRRGRPPKGEGKSI